MSSPEPPQGNPVAQFFGVMLIIVGILIAALCGLCTLAVIGTSLSLPSDQQGYGGGGMIGVALIIGGIPTVVGGLMIWGGIAVLRSGRKRPPKVKLDTFD
jgi:hypothetical protein